MHESPAWMTIPLILLAAASALGGIALVWNHNLAHWLEPIYPELEERQLQYIVDTIAGFYRKP